MSRALALLLAPLVIPQGTALRRDIERLPPPPPPWMGGNSSPGALQLLVVGDSTAVGIGVDTVQESLAGQLVRRMNASGGRGRWVGWRVVGTSGATSGEVLERHRAEMLSEAADVAVVLVGWNDALKLRPVSAFETDLDALLRTLRDGNPGIRIIVVAPPAFGRFAVLPQPLRFVLGVHARALTRAAAKVAARNRCGMAIGFDGASVARDGFHPDTAGYARLAENVLTALGRRALP